VSYEAVIEQVRTLPESLLTSVSAFIKLLETEQGEIFTVQTIPQTSDKKAFFDLAGKIHLDSSSVTELREASLL
jgi:ubiquinone biosynthesis protein Coq4